MTNNKHSYVYLNAILCIFAMHHVAGMTLPITTHTIESQPNNPEHTTENVYQATRETNSTTENGLIDNYITKTITVATIDALVDQTTDGSIVQESFPTSSSDINSINDGDGGDIKESTLISEIETTLTPESVATLPTRNIVGIELSTDMSAKVGINIEKESDMANYTPRVTDVFIPGYSVTEDEIDNSMGIDINSNIEQNMIQGHPTPEVADSTYKVPSNRISRSLRDLLLPSPTSSISDRSTDITMSMRSVLMTTLSSLDARNNGTTSVTIDWRRINSSKDDADSLAWITSAVFTRRENLGEDNALLGFIAQLSDHQKIPESMIEDLQHCQSISDVYNSLRSINDIFYSYGQYVNVLAGATDLRAVKNRYCGLRKSIRKLIEPSSTGDCSLQPQNDPRPDHLKIVETLATLNLLAVRTSRVLQAIGNMHGRCPGV